VELFSIIPIPLLEGDRGAGLPRGPASHVDVYCVQKVVTENAMQGVGLAVPLQCHAMTARDALAQAVAAPPGDRLRFETICGPRGACRREALTNDPGRWTWCPDCLTLSDDYGVAVNPIPEFARAH
jgi:hypothetical protein